MGFWRSAVSARMAAKRAAGDLFTKAIRNVREIRIHYDPAESGGIASASLRKYTLDNYHAAKAANPDLPILVREATDVLPKVWVRYDKGVERSASVTPSNHQQVADVFNKLLQE